MLQNQIEDPETRSISGVIAKIKYIEDKIKSKPGERDYRCLISTLGDFGIKVKRRDIPEFRTVGEMERWQRKQIKLNLE